MFKEDSGKFGIDQNVFLDLLIGYGQQYVAKFMGMKIFIHGITGVGVEVAKNIVLLYPKTVTLFDSNLIQISDLGRNLFAREDQIGKMTRANSAKLQLCKMNQKTIIQTSDCQDIKFIVDNHDCVIVLDNYDRKYLRELNKACRQRNKGFIYGGNLGLYGFCFVDFGDRHLVTDQKSQQNNGVYIRNIYRNETGSVKTYDYQKHNFSIGDTILLSQFEDDSNNEINGKYFKITDIKSNQQFCIGNTMYFSQNKNKGIAIKITKPIQIKFNSFQTAINMLKNQNNVIFDGKNFQDDKYQLKLHFILDSIFDYWQKNKRLPRRLNQEDAEQLFYMVLRKQCIYEIDKQLVNNVSLYAECQIVPFCSFWAGIVSTEVFKITGKYKPLQNWLYYQFFQLLPTSSKQIIRSLCINRYMDIDTIFGSQFVQKLSRVCCMVVGAGTKASEITKMLALLGFGRKSDTKIYCIDNAIIKPNSITKNCLYKSNQINQYKSKILCQALYTLNSQCNFISINQQISKQKQFPDQLWDKIDFILCAADLQKTKTYCDNLCVQHEKPMFQFGVFGMKSHSQVIIPFMTNTYTDVGTHNEILLPLGLSPSNIPYKIENTIMKSTAKIQNCIIDPISCLNDFYSDKKVFVDKVVGQKYTDRRKKLRQVKKMYLINISRSYEQCLRWAKQFFNQQFNQSIKLLLQQLPKDRYNEQTKTYFWQSRPSKCPDPIIFDPHDNLHIKFLQSASMILAGAFNIKIEENNSKIIKQKIYQEHSEFGVKKQKQITQQNDNLRQLIQQQQIKSLSKQMMSLQVKSSLVPNRISFSHKNIQPLHLDLVQSFSNLIARNYKIKQASRLKIHQLTSNICPKLVAPVSMCSGFMCLQIIKFLMEKPLKIHKNIFSNLEVPSIVLSQLSPPLINKDCQYDPIFCGPVKAIPSQFSKWRKIHIQGPLTVEQFKQKIQKDFSVTIFMMTIGPYVLYSEFQRRHLENLQKDILQLYELLKKQKIVAGKKSLQICLAASGQDGCDILMPDIKYWL